MQAASTLGVRDCIALSVLPPHRSNNDGAITTTYIDVFFLVMVSETTTTIYDTDRKNKTFLETEMLRPEN